MGLFDRLFGRQLAAVHIVESAPKFVSSITIDPWMLGGDTDPAISYTSPLSRDQALLIPAVKRARDLVCGAIAQFPIVLQDSAGQPTTRNRALLDQPEVGKTAAASLAELVEDLMFHEVGWWRTNQTYGPKSLPHDVVRLPPENVNIVQELVPFPEGQAMRWPDNNPFLLRFDSPSKGLLSTGRRVLRALARLESAALKYTSGTPMNDHFEPASEGLELDDTEVQEFLQSWEAARNDSATGFVPWMFKYVNDEGPNAEQMQLVAAREFGITEVARLTGIDAEDLSVAVTSRTYANMQDRRRSFVENVLGPYMRTIEQRLSMNDITPEGLTARFDTTAFLRLDDKAAAETDKILIDAKVLLPDEAREKRGLAPLPEQPEPAAPAPAETEEEPVDDEAQFTLTAPAEIAFRVNKARRTIHGLAVPYGVASSPDMVTKSRYRFKRGDLTWPDNVARVPLTALIHDSKAQVGVSVAFTETDQALLYTAYVAPGPDGDALLENAGPTGTWRGLSVGLGKGGRFRLAEDGVYESEHPSPIVHVTVTPSPAFEDSRVLEVAASAAPDTEGGPQMGDTQAAETLEAAFTTDAAGDVLELAFTTQSLDAQQPAPAEPATEQPAQQPAAPATEPPAFATAEQLAALTAAMTGLTDQLSAAGEQPTPAPGAPGAPAFATTKVDEEPLYRFDGLRGKREFSGDLKAAFTAGDSDAKQHLQEFLAAAFAVTQAGVASVNPARYRPEMYVDYIEKAAPVYTAIHSGALSDNTPFIIPKFGTASGLVGDHTAGVEPTPGTFTTTSQTVTPTVVSGRAEIPREIIDAGGNPQVSGLIWRQMNRAYAEALEAEAAALLNAVAAAELGAAALTGSAALAGDLNKALAEVPFIDGGDLMDFFLGHQGLYKALGGLTDTTGRPMFPHLSPSNASGTAAAKFRRLDIDGWELVPAKSLGAIAANLKSFLGYTDAVHVWNSAPNQIQYEQVANVNIGLMGYKASAVTQSALVRKITY